MEEEIGFDLLLVLLEVIVTGDHVIGPGRGAVGLPDAAIDDKDVVIDLDDRAFFAFFV